MKHNIQSNHIEQKAQNDIQHVKAHSSKKEIQNMEFKNTKKPNELEFK